MAGDIYGNTSSTPQKPLTADKAIFDWGGGNLVGAVQVQVSYAQQVNRRRTIGSTGAVIWAALPNGQITIQRMLTTDAKSLFTAPGWQACNPGTITISVGGGCDGNGGLKLTATGCVVTQFGLSLEAESLTVMDNVVIEFLQLTPG